MQTMIQGSAEMAAGQRNQLEVTTNQFENRLQNIFRLMGEAEDGVTSTKDALVS